MRKITLIGFGVAALLAVPALAQEGGPQASRSSTIIIIPFVLMVARLTRLRRSRYQLRSRPSPLVFRRSSRISPPIRTAKAIGRTEPRRQRLQQGLHRRAIA